MTAGRVQACPGCGVAPVGGRFCRSCGRALVAGHNAASDPRRPATAAGAPREVLKGPRAGKAGAASATRSEQPGPSTSSTGARNGVAAKVRTADAQAPVQDATEARTEQVPASRRSPHVAQGADLAWAPPPGWVPLQSPVRRTSTGLAVGLTLAVLLVALAIATTVILLVANGGGGDRTGIVAPPGSTTAVREAR